MTYLSVFVPGHPAPQGSKRFLGVKGGKGVTVESSKKVAPWRADIREKVAEKVSDDLIQFPRGRAVTVDLVFVMPRPASTSKRFTPPAVKRPDVDKLARAVLDALSSAELWVDDSQVTRLVAAKRLAQIGERSGCHIQVTDSADQRELKADRLRELTADAAGFGEDTHD